MRALLEANQIDGENNSGLAAVDIRAKLFITLATSISTVAISGIWGLVVLFACSIIYALFMKRIKILFVAYALILVMAVLAVICMFIINIFIPVMKNVTYASLIIPFLRMAVMVNVILPLAFSSRIQSMLTALKSFKLALYIYLPVTVMIRFIPTFINDMKQIAETVKIRGVKLSPLSFITKPLFMGRVLFMPLLFRSLRTSEELGIAAELKGLGLNDEMKPYKALQWGRKDTYTVIALSLAIGVAVFVHILTYVPNGTGGML